MHMTSGLIWKSFPIIFLIIFIFIIAEGKVIKDRHPKTAEEGKNDSWKQPHPHPSGAAGGRGHCLFWSLKTSKPDPYT